jgi:hypothetical protein
MLKNKFQNLELFTNSTKVIAILGIITLAGGSFLKNPFVDASSPISPEISLNLNFNFGTTLEGIYSKLNNNVGIDIQNITGEVFIGGKSQPISATIENDDTVGNSKGTKALDEYVKQEDNFLALLTKIETEGLPASLESQRETLKPLLDEFTQKEVSETKNEALRKPSQITSISLMGSKLAVASTREKLASVTKEVTELDLVELEVISKDTQLLIANNSLILKDNSKIEMSQDRIILIDSKLAVAPDGSKFVTEEAKKIMSSDELNYVQSALEKYNKAPEALKENRQEAGQLLTNVSDLEAKGVSISSIFESIKTKAFCSSHRNWLGIHYGWWGFSLNNSHCGWSAIGYFSAVVGTVLAMTAWAICTYVSGGWLATLCAVGTKKVVGTLMGILGGLYWKASNDAKVYCGGWYWGLSQITVNRHGGSGVSCY